MAIYANRRVNLGLDSSGRPLYIDRRTLDMLNEVEQETGLDIIIVQGGWRPVSTYSAATHSRGGVVDLRVWHLTASEQETLVRALRMKGFAAWLRTKAQGFDPHIHAIAIGSPILDPSAQRQVDDYYKGLNGLASKGKDDGPRVDVIVYPVHKTRPRTGPTPAVTAAIVANRVYQRRVRKINSKNSGIQVKQKERWLQQLQAHNRRLRSVERKAA